MWLRWLQVVDFRCHHGLEFEPAKDVNVLVGDNGSGKTSILEALGYLGLLRSFRGSPDGALVRVGSGAAVVRGEFQRDQGGIRIEIEIPEDGRRRVLVNGKRAQSRADVAEHVAVVAFLPDDLDVVKRGPSQRRDYLDDVAIQLWPGTAVDQHEYERALRQRNALLRQEGRGADRPTLEVWDQRLSQLGARVLVRRLGALARLGPVLAEFYGEVAGPVEKVSWLYTAASLGEVEVDAEELDLADGLKGALEAARPGDLERRNTSVGPHRDEVVFSIGGRDVRTRASQGEQRALAIGLRVAAYELIRRQRSIAPVLVLDDVFSELDGQRSGHLVERLPEGQVFVSTAREEDMPLHGARWIVEQGEVRREGSL
jgi:DNA replication and repair protein RecF